MKQRPRGLELAELVELAGDARDANLRTGVRTCELEPANLRTYEPENRRANRRNGRWNRRNWTWNSSKRAPVRRIFDKLDFNRDLFACCSTLATEDATQGDRIFALVFITKSLWRR